MLTQLPYKFQFRETPVVYSKTGLTQPCVVFLIVCVLNEAVLTRVHNLSRVVRNLVFGVSDQVRHKPGCTTTEDGWRLEISDLGRRGIVLAE